MRSRTERPVRVRQPWVTTSPSRASRAAMTRSFGSSVRISRPRRGAEDDLARAPVAGQRASVLRRADAAAHADGAEGADAPRRARRSSPRPWPRRGRSPRSRPTRPKRESSGRGSPASSALSSPPTSWTVEPPSRSMLGTITAGSGLRSSRTGTPRAARSRLTSATVVSASWKIGRREHGARARVEGRAHVGGRARAAARDDRDPDGGGERAEELGVVALAGAVAIPARRQDLRRRPPRRRRRPADRVPAGPGAAAVDCHLPAGRGVVGVLARASRARPRTARRGAC